jgi:hypothetical protein
VFFVGKCRTFCNDNTLSKLSHLPNAHVRISGILLSNKMLQIRNQNREPDLPIKSITYLFTIIKCFITMIVSDIIETSIDYTQGGAWQKHLFPMAYIYSKPI